MQFYFYNKNMKGLTVLKKLVILALAALVAFSFSACKDKTEPGNNEVDTATEVNTENTVTENQESETPNKENEQPDEKTMKITYNGRVDLSSIEVSFDTGEYGTMQLSGEIKESFDSFELEEGSVIEVVYTEKGGQKIITGIKK